MLVSVLLMTVLLSIFRWFNPPATPLMVSEYHRLGHVAYSWVDLENMSPNVPLAIVASEDANFCLHNGFDFDAISAAMEDGTGRGASTISQQTAKNVFLWPVRNWVRKGVEAELTVFIEAIWTKRRILEVYLNVAEFGEGVFGIGEAAHIFYGKEPQNLLLGEASRLAMLLPSPRTRAVRTLTSGQRRRASRVAAGAATIRIDGRADCFLP